MKVRKWLYSVALMVSPFCLKAQLENPFGNNNNNFGTLQTELADTALLSSGGDLSADQNTPTMSSGSFTTEDEGDPGGPTNPPSDVPVNGGLVILLIAGLGAGYRSFLSIKKQQATGSTVMA